MSETYDQMMADETEVGAMVRRLLPDRLDQNERNGFEFIWEYQARSQQLPPPGDWRIWMIMAGRGFGKTRSGAEWVRMIADQNPDARIALVSSSLAEARAVMVEGESGLMAICRPGHKPHFEPSLHRIRFENGAQAQKEFFVNQALCLLDALHDRAVTASRNTPPESPAEGSCYRITAPAGAAWSGRDDHIAVMIRWRLALHSAARRDAGV